MSDPIRIEEVYKEIECHCKESGHSWTERGELRGYEVWGGMFCRTFHKTLKSAEARAEFLRKYLEKFPFIPHRSRRELKYMEKHKVPIEENCTRYDFCKKCQKEFSITGLDDQETLCPGCR